MSLHVNASMFHRFVLAVAAGAATSFFVIACPTSSSEGEGEGEGEEKPCGDFVPEPADVCIPVCGNEQGVGQPCTRGGGECNDFIGNGAGFCTVDFDQTTNLAYCTRPCDVDADCGSDSACVGDPADPGGSTGCIPAACVEGGEGEGEVVAGEGEGE